MTLKGECKDGQVGPAPAPSRHRTGGSAGKRKRRRQIKGDDAGNGSRHGMQIKGEGARRSMKPILPATLLFHRTQAPFPAEPALRVKQSHDPRVRRRVGRGLACIVALYALRAGGGVGPAPRRRSTYDSQARQHTSACYRRPTASTRVRSSAPHVGSRSSSIHTLAPRRRSHSRSAGKTAATDTYLHRDAS